MIIFRGVVIIFAIFCMGFGKATAKASEDDYFRNFWAPKYHARLLSYCSFDGKTCGMDTANQYCQMMGYKRADKEIKANNVGLTYYLSTKGGCRGWECDGFKLIRCVGKFSNDPPKVYSYRFMRFVFPRFEDYRIDWCYRDGQGCGHRAAYSYCRRLGYLKAKSYKKQEHVPATKALGNQKLCFGKQCSGFSEIICYR